MRLSLIVPLFLTLQLLSFFSVAHGIYSVSGDTDGSISAVSQGSNLPPVFASSFSDIFGGTANSQSQLYYRKTSSTYVKFYVKCVGMTSSGGASATYTLSYEFDGAPAKSVGTAFTASSNPYILIEGLTDGNHKVVTTCKENKNSITSTTPASDTVESDPLIFNWKVDTAGAQTVSFSATPPTYDNNPTGTFTFTSSRAQDNYGTLAWTCYLPAFSSSWYACGTAGAQTTSTTIDDSYLKDGAHTFQVKATLTPTVTGFYWSDLGTLTGTASYTWTRDTKLPQLSILSSPAAKSQWFSGKSATFEFACKAGEVSCTYMCSLDGKNSADYSSSTRQPGFFSCTSPLVLPVKSSHTHSFQAYAVDAAGNKSPQSSIYMFYADGTTPEIMFDFVDTTQVDFARSLNSGSAGQYYALNDAQTYLGDPMYIKGTTTVASTLIDNVQYVDATTKVACADAAACAANTPINSSAYHTVFQFPYSPTTPVTELTNTYGAILGQKLCAME